MDWNQAIEEYKSYLKIERGLSMNSISSYENDVISLKDYLLNNKVKESPTECSPETINSFIYNSSKNNSSRSQARKISGLKSFFKFLVFEGYLKISPMSNVESPKLGRKLPDILKTLSYYNPFFHMIDGFRYSFLGQSDGSIKFGIIFLLIISFITWYISYLLYRKGYKIKS